MADFEDPFRSSDSVLRPRPGGGRRGAGPPPASEDVAPAPLPASARDAFGLGLGSLARASCPVLLMAGRFRGVVSVPSVESLRRQALDEIHTFEETARANGVSNELILAGRYALCATLDEAVLSTPWGAQSEWARQTLLVVLHREAWGGEKFFELLDRTSKDPERYIDLLELQYLCLALGFGGKYSLADRGQAQLAEIQRGLFRTISDVRGAAPAELALHWRGLEDRRNPVVRYVPWWVVAAAATVVVVVAYIFFYARLGSAAAPIHEQLAGIGLESFAAPAPGPPPAGPRLRDLLASDAASGQLQIDERNGRTVVTLPTAEMFASGSATVNPAFDGLFRRIAAAIDRVGGRVLVVGHTDDQPLRSMRYGDNYELSRARAISVVQLLSHGAGGGRFTAEGAGSSQPVVAHATNNADRARNRRVEIIHIPGAE